MLNTRLRNTVFECLREASVGMADTPEHIVYGRGMFTAVVKMLMVTEKLNLLTTLIGISDLLRGSATFSGFNIYRECIPASWEDAAVQAKLIVRR